jgi:hypothetical protein
MNLHSTPEIPMRPRRPITGARIVHQGIRAARSRRPQDRAAAIQRITDAQIGDGPRWSVRRVYDRIAHDETLRYLLMAGLSWFLLTVLLFGLIG